MKVSLKIYAALFILMTSIFAVQAKNEVQRGTGVPAKCGDIIDSDFTSNYEEDTFIFNITAGDSLDILLVPLSEQLKTLIFLTGPTNLGVAGSNVILSDPSSLGTRGLDVQPKMNSGVLGASGNYVLRVINFGGYYYYDSDRYDALTTGGVGAYTLYVGCVRDGIVINPGDPILAPTGEILVTPIPTASPTPTLPDFSTAQNKPLIPGAPSIGAISPGGTELYSYTLDATSGGILDLTFSKLSGNLNLSFVVMSSDSQVLFQVNLLNLGELKTSLTLPTAGTYTIGVFRIDLLPPAAPEPTAFQVQGVLNP